MFGRRSKLTMRSRVGRAVWLQSGWRRSWSYGMHRLGRLTASPYSLAAGFACGAAVSFLPFIGFHFLLAGLLAFCMRASILASALGTVVGNPWTFPFIWISTYRVGRWLGFGGTSGVAERIDFGGTLARALDALWDLDVPHLVYAVWPIVKPMTAGGLVLGAAAWVVAYVLLRPVLAAYKEARSHRLQRGQARADAERAERLRV